MDKKLIINDRTESGLKLRTLQRFVSMTYKHAFGRTPLRQRIDDIFGEAIELSRFTDLKNLREETGDLLSSTLQLCNENGWNADELINENLTKIAKRSTQYKSLGRKTKVALLCGAFNPITKGHIEIAKLVLDTSKTFDEVWINPCRTHLYNKKLTAPIHRLAMCEIAARVDARIKVFDYEIKNNLGGETYHFVKRLLEEKYAKDEYDFSYIIGLDNALTFDKWVNYKDLERMIRFVVVPRKGYKPDPKVNWYLKPPHIYLTGEKIIESSSTAARQNLEVMTDNQRALWEVPESLREIMDKNVLQYIFQNELYKENTFLAGY